MTPAQRALRSRLGGLTTAARGHVNTAPARAAFAARFYAGIPDDLPPGERDRRAAAAKRLYFARLAYKSALTRTMKAGPDRTGPALEARRVTDEPTAAA